jgi:structural maintenance of chromosome 1
LFLISYSFAPSPFFILDEVDAALDPKNSLKIAEFIKLRSKETKALQCIVISLKDIFFEHADALVGIYKNKEEQSSHVLTLNLEPYRL